MSLLAGGHRAGVNKFRYTNKVVQLKGSRIFYKNGAFPPLLQHSSFLKLSEYDRLVLEIEAPNSHTITELLSILPA